MQRTEKAILHRIGTDLTANLAATLPVFVTVF
jgi:hypothetical protein